MSHLRKSLFLSFLDKYSSLVINIAVGLLLARLLTPYDIGVYSIASSLYGFASSLRDFGISPYLIQEKELTVSRQRSAMGVIAVISWTVGALLIVASGFIADFYKNPDVGKVILVLSINFFFIPFSTVVVTMLRREMNFGALYRMGLAVAISRSSAAIGLALLGFHFMAMAWSSIAGVVALVIMGQFVHPSSGRLLPSLKEWRRVISFGVLSTGSQLLLEAKAAAPDALIGRLMSPVAVGFYSRAVGLLALFSQAVMEGLSPVALSEVGMRHRGGGDVRGFVLQTLTHVTALGWPFFSFVALMTLPIMRVLFGGQWDEAVPLTKLLCIAGMIGILDCMTWAVLQGTGSVGKYLTLQVFVVPAQIAILGIALVFGKSLQAVGISSILNASLQVTASMIFLRRTVGLRPIDVFSAVVKSAGVAVCSSIAPALVAIFATLSGPGHFWIPLLIAGAGAGVGFIGGVFLLKHPLMNEMTKLFAHARGIILGRGNMWT